MSSVIASAIIPFSCLVLSLILIPYFFIYERRNLRSVFEIERSFCSNEFKSISISIYRETLAWILTIALAFTDFVFGKQIGLIGQISLFIGSLLILFSIDNDWIYRFLERRAFLLVVVLAVGTGLAFEYVKSIKGDVLVSAYILFSSMCLFFLSIWIRRIQEKKSAR